LFHVKAYISTVSWVLLPLLLLFSGNLLRGFRDVIGRLWLLFLAWICLAVPFSVWRGGSLALLMDYVPHGWIQLFYFAAFAISLRHCRRLMNFLIASNVLLLLDCWWGGSMANGRLEIPDSMFFRNANDLSLQLIIAITQFMYLLYQRQIWKRVAGAAAILVALVYMLETGARGAFLAVIALAFVSLALTKNRLRFVLALAAVAAGALALAPSSVFHRVTLIAIEPQTAAAADERDEVATGRGATLLVRCGDRCRFRLLHAGGVVRSGFGDVCERRPGSKAYLALHQGIPVAVWRRRSGVVAGRGTEAQFSKGLPVHDVSGDLSKVALGRRQLS
jgi:hypothetical protein